MSRKARQDDDKYTHFGYDEVRSEDKASRVAEVFASVAPHYDVMNDLMSFGMHRIWKRIAVMMAGLRKGQRVLDLAAGTGDLTKLLAKRVGPKGEVWLTDINEAMLQRGRDRMLDLGLNQVKCAQVNAEDLPFTDGYFDAVTIGFGLRNVTNQAKALAAIERVLKPGGRCIVLEFSKPTSKTLARVYDQYSFQVLPRLGQWIANDGDSYRYLAESIRMHPEQCLLRDMMQDAGLVNCDYTNLLAGVVAIHRGYTA
jgi:demethylmenaquinone methyltransferase / 2-methoxy-6-polyprenyl-1,4-benzoquinol methylase